ncbi:MAG: hypothetical protein ACUVSV_06925 [Armatimonadota bacterium]
MPVKERTYPLEVFPPEHQRMEDPVTGADLLFVTTHPARDLNLYFHERSFLADESLLLFTSDRERGGLMGYLFVTGELVRFYIPEGGVGGATACKSRNSVFVLRGKQVLELALKMRCSKDPSVTPSQVVATERGVCILPENLSPATALNENADGRLLSLGVNFKEGGWALSPSGCERAGCAKSVRWIPSVGMCNGAAPHRTCSPLQGPPSG